MTKNEVFEALVRNLREIIPELEEVTITPNDSMVALGANSIDRAEVIAMTMEDYSLQVPRVEFAKAKNLGELAEIFYEKIQG